MINLTGVDVNADGNEEDNDEYKEDDGVNQNRQSASLHIVESYVSAVPRYLTQQPRR